MVTMMNRKFHRRANRYRPNGVPRSHRNRHRAYAMHSLLLTFVQAIAARILPFLWFSSLRPSEIRRRHVAHNYSRGWQNEFPCSVNIMLPEETAVCGYEVRIGRSFEPYRTIFDLICRFFLSIRVLFLSFFFYFFLISYLYLVG